MKKFIYTTVLALLSINAFASSVPPGPNSPIIYADGCAYNLITQACIPASSGASVSIGSSLTGGLPNSFVLTDGSTNFYQNNLVTYNGATESANIGNLITAQMLVDLDNTGNNQDTISAVVPGSGGNGITLTWNGTTDTVGSVIAAWNASNVVQIVQTSGNPSDVPIAESKTTAAGGETAFKTNDVLGNGILIGAGMTYDTGGTDLTFNGVTNLGAGQSSFMGYLKSDFSLVNILFASENGIRLQAQDNSTHNQTSLQVSSDSASLTSEGNSNNSYSLQADGGSGFSGLNASDGTNNWGVNAAINNLQFLANGYTYTWPNSSPTNNYVLSTDGSGNLSWVADSGAPTIGLNQVAFGDPNTGAITSSQDFLFQIANQDFPHEFFGVGDLSGSGNNTWYELDDSLNTHTFSGLKYQNPIPPIIFTGTGLNDLYQSGNPYSPTGDTVTLQVEGVYYTFVLTNVTGTFSLSDTLSIVGQAGTNTAIKGIFPVQGASDLRLSTTTPGTIAAWTIGAQVQSTSGGLATLNIQPYQVDTVHIHSLNYGDSDHFPLYIAGNSIPVLLDTSNGGRNLGQNILMGATTGHTLGDSWEYSWSFTNGLLAKFDGFQGISAIGDISNIRGGTGFYANMINEDASIIAQNVFDVRNLSGYSSLRTDGSGHLAQMGDVANAYNGTKLLVDVDNRSITAPGYSSATRSSISFAGSGNNDLVTAGNYIGTVSSLTFTVTVGNLNTPYVLMDNGGPLFLLGEIATTPSGGSCTVIDNPPVTGGGWSLNCSAVSGTFNPGEVITGSMGGHGQVTQSLAVADLFSWTDSGGGFGNDIPMDAFNPYSLEAGVQVSWGTSTGHMVGDVWDWTYTLSFAPLMQILTNRGTGIVNLGDYQAIANATSISINDGSSAIGINSNSGLTYKTPVDNHRFLILDPANQVYHFGPADGASTVPYFEVTSSGSKTNGSLTISSGNLRVDDAVSYGGSNVTGNSGLGYDDKSIQLVDATSSNIVVTLPSCDSGHEGKEFTLKRTDASINTFMIAPTGSNTIEAINANYTPAGVRPSTVLHCDGGGAWWKL